MYLLEQSRCKPPPNLPAGGGTHGGLKGGAKGSHGSERGVICKRDAEKEKRAW